MAIRQKDTKILWARAMGRCSLCREHLVVEASAASPSHGTVVGEECHIVAESTSGPRGQSSLSLADRGRYPNLILLCRKHHKIVDDVPVDWPIEKLHQIKADHELWVESLVPDVPDPVEEIYVRVVNSISQNLLLEKWDWLTDNAIRNLVPEEFIDGIIRMRAEIGRANWPGRWELLEAAILNLGQRANGYAAGVAELSYLNEGWYREDKRWKSKWVPDYDARIARSGEWQESCFKKLWNLTHALNEYAERVREILRPSYFLYEGKFGIDDSLGVRNDGDGVIYIPSQYMD